MGFYDNTVEVARRTMILFFLVDTSGSMRGTKMDAVNKAISRVIPELAKLSANNADAEIKIAVLTFIREYGLKWLTPQPVEAEKFHWTDLEADGNEDYGAAYRELNAKLSRNEFMKEAIGSYAPAIFLLSDGWPVYEYKEELAELKKNKWFAKAIKAAVAIGDGADKDILSEFTGNSETVLETHSSEALMKLIRFVSVRASQIGSKSSTVGVSSKTGEVPSKMDDFAAHLKEDVNIEIAGIDGDDFD